MITLFTGLKGLLKTRAISTDGPVFRLHYRWTVLILLSCSILLTCRQHFGEPIHCLQRDVARLDALENFCWIHSTFILPRAWNSTVGVEVPHPGIDRHTPGQTKVHHAYYQWVALVLLLQGIFFYLPRYMWKTFEKGMMKDLTQNLHDPLLPGAECKKSYKLLVHALHIHWGHFGLYFKKFIACEILTLLNVLGQMWFLDTFLGGVFTSFGIDVARWTQWDQEYRTDPLVKAFPRMTKCQFHDYGSSGDIQRVDALCILPLNVLNEKIFIFLWFWMIILSCLTASVLFFHLMLGPMRSLRYCVLITRVPNVNKGALDKVVMGHRSYLSDWFVLYLLSKNMDAKHFRCVIQQLASAMEQNGYATLPFSKPSTSKEHSSWTYV